MSNMFVRLFFFLFLRAANQIIILKRKKTALQIGNTYFFSFLRAVNLHSGAILKIICRKADLLFDGFFKTKCGLMGRKIPNTLVWSNNLAILTLWFNMLISRVLEKKFILFLEFYIMQNSCKKKIPAATCYEYKLDWRMIQSICLT